MTAVAVRKIGDSKMPARKFPKSLHKLVIPLLEEKVWTGEEIAEKLGLTFRELKSFFTTDGSFLNGYPVPRRKGEDLNKPHSGKVFARGSRGGGYIAPEKEFTPDQLRRWNREHLIDLAFAYGVAPRRPEHIEEDEITRRGLMNARMYDRATRVNASFSSPAGDVADLGGEGGDWA